MKKNKHALCLALMIVPLLWCGGRAYAVNNAISTPPISGSSSGQAQDPANSKHKQLHSERKAAAKRLKVVHQQDHQHKLNAYARAHHGYTGQGLDAGGFGNHQKHVSIRKGGAK